MMKRALSLATVVSAAVLTSTAIFAVVNPTQACILSERNGTTTRQDEGGPTLFSTQSDSDRSDINKMAIAGLGIAALAGLVATGVAYKARRARQKVDTTAVDVPQEESFEANSFRIPVPPEALSASTSQQETSDSSTEKESTLVS